MKFLSKQQAGIVNQEGKDPVFREIFSSEDWSIPRVTFEDKMFDLLTGLKEKNQRLLGLLLMAGAGLFLTLGNCLVQYIYKKNHDASIMLSSFEVLLVRSSIQLFFVAMLMFYGKVHPYGGKPKNLFLLMAMGVVEVSAIIFVYLALEKIPVGDATVLQFTAPIFTVLFSFVLLRKGCGWLDAIIGMISFIGVVIIAKPDIINKTHKEIHNHIANKNRDILKDHDYLLGTLFALIAAISLSLFFILNKLNGKKLDVTLTIFYPSVLGVLCSPIAMAISKEKFLLGEMDSKYWIILIVVGFISFVGLLFMGQALQLEDAGPAVLIRNCDVIYAFVLQYFLMNHAPSIAALVGTLIILFCTSILALNRVFNLERKCCMKYGCETCQRRYEEDEPNEANFMLLTDNNDDEEEINLK